MDNKVIQDKIQMFLRLLTCALMLAAVAIHHHGRLAGHEISAGVDDSPPPVLTGSGGDFVVDTRDIASDILGYGGPVPLSVTVTGGKVSGIEALRNAETPDFFRPVEEELLSRYVGMTPGEVLASEVDAVSGATLSSEAAVATLKRAMGYAIDHDAVAEPSSTQWKEVVTPRFAVVLCVVLMGAIVPLFFRGRRYRLVQLALNVVVLGFWSGTFLSYSMLTNYLANGISLAHCAVPAVMLATAFIYPFFGKKSHYCTWQCPLGSLQELAGKCTRRKLKLSPVAVRMLERFRDGLWALLMLLMWCGVGFEWMDYEPFSAFIFTQASWAVIAIALLSVALSLVVTRPYCRFVCPTGNLFRITQNPK